MRQTVKSIYKCILGDQKKTDIIVAGLVLDKISELKHTILTPSTDIELLRIWEEYRYDQ